MAVAGIIAEFNPLHNGHEYIIKKAKAEKNTVICLLSGNFTQRGDTAVIEKRLRASAALKAGADIVAELPVLWSMSTAQNFALGGVWQLYNLGCDEIVFGSECGDTDRICTLAEILESEKFTAFLKEELKKGITFAAAREKAALKADADALLLKNPNDNLGIEYINAAKRLGLPIAFRAVKREGAMHTGSPEGRYAPASVIRDMWLSGNFGESRKYFPEYLYGDIHESDISDIKRLETAVLSTLRRKTAQQFSNLPDISEGIENRLYSAVRDASNLDELYNAVKSKRYTLARVRRLVISAFLEFDDEFFMNTPPFVRILGFGKSGGEHLKHINSQIPVITRPAEIKSLDAKAKKVFESECRATDIYALSLKKPLCCGIEYKRKLLKTEAHV